MLKYILYLVIALFVLSTGSCKKDDDSAEETQPLPETGSAKYMVTFNASWSEATHPTEFPPNPHFSGLIGMTHSADTSLFYTGTLASLGIKDVAELGRKDNLIAEMKTAIATGKGQFIISGGGIGSSPNSVSVEFDIQLSHPIVSITSMIAPSPDWFVAVHDLLLYDNGKWVQEVTIPVNIYDAGTDSGISFTSDNLPTSPPENITLITTPPLGVDGVVASLGNMVFKRIE